MTTVNNKQRNRVKMQIANIYKEIENAKKSVSYADLNNIFTQDVKDLIAEFEETHTNSYYKQIDNLTDVSTFKDKAQEIVDRAEAAKKDALEKTIKNIHYHYTNTCNKIWKHQRFKSFIEIILIYNSLFHCVLLYSS